MAQGEVKKSTMVWMDGMDGWSSWVEFSRQGWLAWGLTQGGGDEGQEPVITGELPTADDVAAAVDMLVSQRRIMYGGSGDAIVETTVAEMAALVESQTISSSTLVCSYAFPITSVVLNNSRLTTFRM